jgi:hypothetical protein
MLHIGYLLGETAGCEKMDARLVIVSPDDEGDGFQAMGYGFDQVIAHQVQRLLFSEVFVISSGFL